MNSLRTESGMNQGYAWESSFELGVLSFFRNQYIVWRHGESEANAKGEIVSKLKNGIHSYGLTEVGVAQVRRAIMSAKANLGVDENALIYASPFLRCVQTAEVIARIAGTSRITQCDALRERDFGQFEGRTKACYKIVYGFDVADPGHKRYGVESTQEVLQRVAGLVRNLELNYSDKTIVLVTHADVGEILQAACLGLPAYFHRRLPKLVNGEPRILTFSNLKPVYA